MSWSYRYRWGNGRSESPGARWPGSQGWRAGIGESRRAGAGTCQRSRSQSGCKRWGGGEAPGGGVRNAGGGGNGGALGGGGGGGGGVLGGAWWVVGAGGVGSGGGVRFGCGVGGREGVKVGV